jgi:hypothetical protein
MPEEKKAEEAKVEEVEEKKAEGKTTSPRLRKLQDSVRDYRIQLVGFSERLIEDETTMAYLAGQLEPMVVRLQATAEAQEAKKNAAEKKDKKEKKKKAAKKKAKKGKK